jgi:hypothetical protein
MADYLKPHQDLAQIMRCMAYMINHAEGGIGFNTRCTAPKLELDEAEVLRWY